MTSVTPNPATVEDIYHGLFQQAADRANRTAGFLGVLDFWLRTDNGVDAFQVLVQIRRAYRAYVDEESRISKRDR